MLWLIVKCQIWAFNKWIRLGQQREMKVSQFINILEIVSPGIIDRLTGSLISGGRELLLGAQCWFSGHIWASLGKDSGMDWWWLPGRGKGMAEGCQSFAILGFTQFQEFRKVHKLSCGVWSKVQHGIQNSWLLESSFCPSCLNVVGVHQKNSESNEILIKNLVVFLIVVPSFSHLLAISATTSKDCLLICLCISFPS